MVWLPTIQEWKAFYLIVSTLQAYIKLVNSYNAPVAVKLAQHCFKMEAVVLVVQTVVVAFNSRRTIAGLDYQQWVNDDCTDLVDQ